jgi:hypothetical protein
MQFTTEMRMTVITYKQAFLIIKESYEQLSKY